MAAKGAGGDVFCGITGNALGTDSIFTSSLRLTGCLQPGTATYINCQAPSGYNRIPKLSTLSSVISIFQHTTEKYDIFCNAGGAKSEDSPVMNRYSAANRFPAAMLSLHCLSDGSGTDMQNWFVCPRSMVQRRRVPLGVPLYLHSVAGRRNRRTAIMVAGRIEGIFLARFGLHQSPVHSTHGKNIRAFAGWPCPTFVPRRV